MSLEPVGTNPALDVLEFTETDQADVPSRYNSSDRSSSKKKYIMTAIVVLVVAVVIGVVLHFFVFTKKPPPSGTSLSASSFTLVDSSTTVPSGSPSAITVTSATTAVYGYFVVQAGKFTTGTASFNNQRVGSFTASSGSTTNNTGTYWFPLTLTAFANQNISPGTVSLTLVDASTNQSIGALSSANTLAINLSSGGGGTSLTVQNFTLVNSSTTIPSGTSPAIEVSSFPTSVYAYFQVTAGTFSSGYVSYNGNNVVTIPSSSPSSVLVVSGNNYWCELDLTSFASDTISALNATLTLIDASSSSPVNSTSANTLSLNLAVMMYNNFSWVYDMTTATEGGTYLGLVQTSYNYSISESGAISSMSFIAPQFYGAGSTWSGQAFAMVNVCETSTPSSFPVKFFGSTNDTCWNGTGYFKEINSSSCTVNYTLTYPSYSNGKGPWLQGGTNYTININDSSACPS